MSDLREMEGRALKPRMKTFPGEQWAASTWGKKSSINWENLHQFWQLEGYWWLLNGWILAMIYWMKLKAEQKTPESMIKGDFSVYLEWKESEGPGDGWRRAQSRAGEEKSTEQGGRREEHRGESRDFTVEETLSKCTLNKVDRVITEIAPNTPVF